MGKIRKTIDRKPIEEWFNIAIARYEVEAGKEYDPCDGYSQVPENNFRAFVTYGKIITLKSILEEY
jgi:hypothetical protein